MFVCSNAELTRINIPIIPSDDLLSPVTTKISSFDQVKSEERVKEVATKHLTSQESSLPEQELKIESSTTIQLRLLFETRYNQPHPWPKASSTRHVYFDCEGLAHYLMTGKIGRFEKIETPNIHKVDLKKHHKPYTCYKIWQPVAPWAREELGFWGGVHFYTHLENGEYISKNGCGPIRFFDSFEEMLTKDAFPFGFTTEDYKEANGIEQAMIGESMIGAIH
ncbi:MAG: hypothetical protein H0U49_10145 [Parachlamydiaceae bacterium]|nr:hypothetical protein [Parachlamydiaceae bacterium]